MVEFTWTFQNKIEIKIFFPGKVEQTQFLGNINEPFEVCKKVKLKNHFETC